MYMNVEIHLFDIWHASKHVSAWCELQFDFFVERVICIRSPRGPTELFQLNNLLVFSWTRRLELLQLLNVSGM